MLNFCRLKNSNTFFLIFVLFVSTIPIHSQDRNSSQNSISTRRTFLNWHQGLGLATWSAWLATNLAGEGKYNEDKNFYKLRDNLPDQILTSYLIQPSNDKLFLYSVVKNFREEEGLSQHGQLAYLTFGLYSATAIMAFTAPSKIEDNRTEGWSTILTHKSMIFIHLPAMLMLPTLGQKLEHGTYADLQNMRNVGWLGFSALTVSIATFYF